MKKNLLFLASGLIILASCSKDELIEVNNSGNIKFRPAIGAVTRANNVLNKSNMGSFKVTAYSDAETSNFFTDLEVESKDQGNTWNTKKTYYWPTSGTLKFFAYSPKDISNVSIDNNSQKIADFSPAEDVATQKDVVVSVNTGTKEQNEQSGVNMNFKHILSQIEVQAKCSNENMKVEVKGVKLCRVSSQGTFTFPTTATDKSHEINQNLWNNSVELKDYSVILDSPIELNTVAKNITGSNNFQMIPQQLTAWDNGEIAKGAYISVLCKISNKDGSKLVQLFPKNSGKFAYSAVKIDTRWEPGKKYIYTLNFFSGSNSGGGRIDPSPTDPRNQGNEEIDKTPGKGGDPILGGPIKFTVEVDEWTNGNTDEINL